MGPSLQRKTNRRCGGQGRKASLYYIHSSPFLAGVRFNLTKNLERLGSPLHDLLGQWYNATAGGARPGKRVLSVAGRYPTDNFSSLASGV